MCLYKMLCSSNFQSKHQFHTMALSPPFTITSVSFLFLTLTLTLTLTLHAQPSPPLFACDWSNPSSRSYPFCNPKLSIHERTKDLVSRLTLDEKLAQLVNSAPPIPRLGIPSYEWWNEALHGVAYSRGIQFNGKISSATSFPQVILTAASFDPHLWYRIGQVCV